MTEHQKNQKNQESPETTEQQSKEATKQEAEAPTTVSDQHPTDTNVPTAAATNTSGKTPNIINIMLVTQTGCLVINLLGVALGKASTWLIGATIGINDDGISRARSTISSYITIGMAVQMIIVLVQTLLRTVVADLYKAIDRKPLLITKRSVRRGVCLGLVLTIVAISLIATISSATDRVTDAAITLSIGVVSFAIGFFGLKTMNRVYDHFFKKPPTSAD